MRLPRIDINMKTSFIYYLWHRLPAPELAQLIFEVSEYFPKDQINQLFQKEVEKLLQQADEEQMLDLLSFRDMDHVGYIDRAVRNAGFREPDLDPLVQDLVVKLLMGSLFSGYKGQPMVARFKVAVTNAIRTLATKRTRTIRRSQPLERDVQEPVRTSNSEEVLDQFRNYVRSRVGPAAIAVLDQRLAGEDTKDLLGSAGLETSYRLKQVVQDLKSALKTFALNDPAFYAAIQQAMDAEQRTLKRRFRKPARVSTQ